MESYCRSRNFHFKNISRHGVKFSLFRFIRDFFFFTVDGYNRDEHLEPSSRLVYYQVLGEPGIASCSRRLDIYLGRWGLPHTLIH